MKTAAWDFSAKRAAKEYPGPPVWGLGHEISGRHSRVDTSTTTIATLEEIRNVNIWKELTSNDLINKAKPHKGL